jgi:hypothetical protein
MDPNLLGRTIRSSEFPPGTAVWVEAALDGVTRRRYATVRGPCPGTSDNLLTSMLCEDIYEYLGKPVSVTLRLVEDVSKVAEGCVQLELDFTGTGL